MSSLEKRKEDMGPGEYEQKAVEAGFVRVCGCDEAGAGPLAGPVYAAAVILPDGAVVDGLNDSKKLSAKQREIVRGRILETALDSAVAFATVEEIETLNILGASLLAMRRAVEALRVRPALLLIDGSVARGFAQPAVAVVGGDARCPSIAAASVLAKVARDAYCAEADALGTMFLAMGADDALAAVERMPGVKAYFILAGDGGEYEEYVSPAMEALILK